MSIQYTRFSLIVDVALDAAGIANMGLVNDIVTKSHEAISSLTGVVVLREQKMYTPKAKKSAVDPIKTTADTMLAGGFAEHDFQPHVADPTLGVEEPGPILVAIAESEAKEPKSKGAKAA